MADITVQVSSPGLTAYGYNSWGSQTFGGDDTTSLTVGSIEAFNNEGWGAYYWGYLVWGQTFEDQIVQVNTPQTNTTWGQSTWGDLGWGAYAGLASQTGEEFIRFDNQASVTGVELNTTTEDVAALTTWGYSTWGSNKWAGDPGFQIIGDSNLQLSTNLINATLTSVNAFGGQVVEVQCPSTPTTWGYDSWGSNQWGQYAGMLVNTGEENITFGSIVFVTSVTLQTSVASLSGELQGTTWGYQTWGSNAWAQTAAYVFGNADVQASTNTVLQTSVGFTSENVQAITIVEVNAPGDIPWGYTEWGYGSWGNIGGLDVEQGGEEVVVPSIEVDVTGNSLILTLTSIAQITADANVTPNTNLLTVSLGDEDATPNTQVTLSTNLLTLSLGTASGETLSTISVTGVTVTSQVGRVFVSAWAVIDIGVTNNWTVVDIAA